MAQLTLLEMTQNILSAMDSDAVNSIDDTVESEQVAQIIKETYYDIINQRDWAFLRTTYTLSGLADINNPTKMLIPDDVSKLLTVRYNKKEIKYLEPEIFKAMLDLRAEEVGVCDANGFILNADPVYYTSYDDEYLTFDGLNTAIDTTLQTSKSWAFGTREPSFTMEDVFIPDLPAKMFPMFLADAKATCFINLKQQPNPREERRAQRGRVIMQNESWRNNEGEGKYNRKVNYGRH